MTVTIVLAGGDPAPAAYDYLIVGNFIGTDVSGTQPLGNLYAGVAVLVLLWSAHVVVSKRLVFRGDAVTLGRWDPRR